MKIKIDLNGFQLFPAILGLTAVNLAVIFLGSFVNELSVLLNKLHIIIQVEF